MIQSWYMMSGKETEPGYEKLGKGQWLSTLSLSQRQTTTTGLRIPGYTSRKAVRTEIGQMGKWFKKKKILFHSLNKRKWKIKEWKDGRGGEEKQEEIK